MGVRTPDPSRLPKHVPAKNAPDFILPNKDTPKTRPILDPNHRRRTFRGVCFCAPTRVHAKFVRFHVFPPEYAENAPHFTLPNKDTPKTHPILDPNLRRRFFRGVCNTPLHGYMKNLAGFIFPHLNTSKTHPILGANSCRKTFRGVCFCALHGYMQNLPGFIFPHPNTPKTHPISLSPIKGT